MSKKRRVQAVRHGKNHRAVSQLWRHTEYRALFRSSRVWDRMTGLTALFAMTGWLDDERPASMLLVSNPGQGKSEMLYRFHGANPWLSYQADLTVRSLYPLLRQSHRGLLTHIVALEFQKYFQRKATTAELCIGTLSEAMAEGVGRISIGGHDEDFSHARLGIIGAMTYGTLEKKRHQLKEMGFLSRAATVPWELPEGEIQAILKRLTHQDASDLRPCLLPSFDHRVRVVLPVGVGERIESFVWRRWRQDSLRPIQRFRALTKASALLFGRRKATVADWAIVQGYNDDVWNKVIEE